VIETTSCKQSEWKQCFTEHGADLDKVILVNLLMLERFYVNAQCATDCGTQNVLQIQACVQLQEVMRCFYMAQAVFQSLCLNFIRV